MCIFVQRFYEIYSEYYIQIFPICEYHYTAKLNTHKLLLGTVFKNLVILTIEEGTTCLFHCTSITLYYCIKIAILHQTFA